MNNAYFAMFLIIWRQDIDNDVFKFYISGDLKSCEKMKNNEELEFNKKKQEIEKKSHIYALKVFGIIVGTSILFNLILNFSEKKDRMPKKAIVRFPANEWSARINGGAKIDTVDLSSYKYEWGLFEKDSCIILANKINFIDLDGDNKCNKENDSILEDFYVPYENALDKKFGKISSLRNFPTHKRGKDTITSINGVEISQLNKDIELGRVIKILE